MSDPAFVVGAAVRDSWTHLEGEIATVFETFHDTGLDGDWLGVQAREITAEDRGKKWLRIMVRPRGVIIIPVRYAEDAWDVEQ